MMRNKGLLKCDVLILKFFKLFKLQDKNLRSMIRGYIISDLKKQNQRHKNVKLNKKIQNVIYELIKQNDDEIAKRVFMIMVDLYKINVWNNEKTANIIAQGCFNRNWKIVYMACQFLIDSSVGNLTFKVEGEISDEEANELMVRSALGSKKTKKKIRQLKREVHKVKRKRIRKNKNRTIQNFLPIDSLDSPQGFCERLFQKLKVCSFKVEVKVLMMQVLSRIIGRNGLLILNFYVFVKRYLMPHVKQIGKMFSFVSEAIHCRIPPDVLR